MRRKFIPIVIFRYHNDDQTLFDSNILTWLFFVLFLIWPLKWCRYHHWQFITRLESIFCDCRAQSHTELKRKRVQFDDRYIEIQTKWLKIICLLFIWCVASLPLCICWIGSFLEVKRWLRYLFFVNKPYFLVIILIKWHRKCPLIGYFIKVNIVHVRCHWNAWFYYWVEYFQCSSLIHFHH